MSTTHDSPWPWLFTVFSSATAEVLLSYTFVGDGFSVSIYKKRSNKCMCDIVCVLLMYGECLELTSASICHSVDYEPLTYTGTCPQPKYLLAKNYSLSITCMQHVALPCSIYGNVLDEGSWDPYVIYFFVFCTVHAFVTICFWKLLLLTEIRWLVLC